MDKHDFDGSKSDHPLKVSNIIRIMKEIRYAPELGELLAYANSLVPSASDYLPLSILTKLVRAELDVDEARIAVVKNQKYFKRVAHLAPTIFNFLSHDKSWDRQLQFLEILDDCFIDVCASNDAPRLDKARRIYGKDLEISYSSVQRAVVTLRKMQDVVGGRYDSYARVESQLDGSDLRQFDSIIPDLRLCLDVIEVMQQEHVCFPEKVLLPRTDTRRIVVDYSYVISSVFGKPAFVTTPGSEFSMVCSLIHEIVTGIREEGLEGAINRYARSQERRSWDRVDNSDDLDNFSGIHFEVKVRSEVIDECDGLLQCGSLSVTAKALLQRRINFEAGCVSELLAAYGPYAMATLDLTLEDDRHPVNFSRRVASQDVRIGKLKRLLAQQGIDAN